MKKYITTIAITIAGAMLTACGTVGTYVPAARGTDTGNIKVDALTSVDTSSRIIPAQVAVPAQPCQQCRQANCPHARPAGTEMRWVTDASRGIEINTHRQSLVRGVRDVGIGVGAAAGGVGVAAGQMRTKIINSGSSANASVPLPSTFTGTPLP